MLRTVLVTLLALPLIAQNLRLKPQPNENPTLLLVDGMGSLPVTFMKEKGQDLPAVIVNDIQDGLGGTVDSKKLSAVWDGKSVAKEIEGPASLTVRTLERLPALADRRITLWFQWPDKSETFTFNVTTHIQQISARLSIAGTPSLAVRDGRGEAIFTFTKAAQVAKPQIQLRSIRENATVLPADRFQATWELFPENAPAGTASMRVVLANTPGIALPFFGTATGEIIFKWADGVSAPVSFTVVNDSMRTFQIIPSTLIVDTGWTQPKTLRILVQNTGNVPITHLRYAAADLQDSSGRRLRIPSGSVPLNEPILKNRSATMDIQLPDSTWAGSYTGALQITADDSQEKSFALMVNSRGPQPCGWPLPLMLFVATLGLGYWVGTQLDKWFEGGGAERNRLLLRLIEIGGDLRGLRARLASASLPNTLRAVDDQIARVESSPSTVAALTEVVNNSDKLIDNLKQLVRNLDWIRANRAHAMEEAQRQLDALSPIAADHQAKSTEILNSLPQLIGGATVGGVERQDDPRPSRAALDKERARNTLLAELATLFAVFVIAYATLFVNHPDYGRLIDYLQTTLYGLGLSTTGAKIIQKAKSSPGKVI